MLPRATYPGQSSASKAVGTNFHQPQAIAIVESGLSHQGLSEKGYKLTGLKQP
ncbi:hypothetical protein NDA01_28930 [Trichocoleus desertorum AS-A10]|uniref:hypothetical protein n=1 Tax=Trichocoleus desertorum TaxID=1481672 RepID=UPI00329863F4